MMKKNLMERVYPLIAAAVAVLIPATALATPIQNARTEANVDWVSAGLGGVGGGSGTINLSGVNGSVQKAFLYWMGIDLGPQGPGINCSLPAGQTCTGNGAYDNETITFNGTQITGVSLGNATSNCWSNPASAGTSRAFRADVTSLVGGNGNYSVSGLSAQAGHNANGLSLVVTFNDGNPNNSRDLVFFEGNDSNNTEGFAGEDNGWHGTLAGINYMGSGTVRAQLHVGDGQTGATCPGNGCFIENSLTFSSSGGTVNIPDLNPGRWDGDSVPSAGSSRATNGSLWDVHTFDVTGAFGGPGSYTLQMDGQLYVADCHGLVLLLLDLPAGSAPATPTVTPTPDNGGECADYFSGDVSKAIPDGSSVDSVLDVSDAGQISDVDVIFLIGTHPFIGDLEFHLRSPMGTDVLIMNRVCGAEDNFDLDLDDSAETTIPCPPTEAAVHLPSSPLSAFNGQSANGQWVLRIFDRQGGNVGTLEDWGLRICSGGASEPTPTPTRTPLPGDDCCSAHEGSGCELSACENCVCPATFNTCCEEPWDELCAMVANEECALACMCGTAPTPTRTASATPSRTVTRTPTVTHTVTRTFTHSATATVTRTPTVTHTGTRTFTATHTFTVTPTYTVTHTPTVTHTGTHTFTATATYTRTPTFTVTHTGTATHTSTATHTFTATYTFTATRTFTLTRTATYTATATATRTPSPSAELVADYIEVSQAVQDLNNSVRLVARKRTYVRFHVHSLDGMHSTTARLTVRRGGDVEVLNPINPRGLILVRPMPNRGVRDHAFLFALPTAFRSGTVELTAELNPNNDPREGNRANNTVTTTVRYEVVPGQFLVMYKIGYSAGGDPIFPSDVHRAQMVVWMRRAFPLSEIRVALRSHFYGRAVVSGGQLLDPSCDKINAFLSSKRLFDLASSTEVPRNGRYYGMVQDAAGFMRGCAAGIPDFVSSGPNGTPAAGDWDTDGSYGDWYGGHELGHDYGRLHAEFCNASGGGPYPHPEGRISPTLTGPTALYGFDIVTRDIYGPDWKDVMSYCPNQWVSDFTYEGLMDFYRSGAGASAVLVTGGVVTDRLVVVGTIDPASMAVSLEPLFIIPNAGEMKERIPGMYAIVLRNADGAELARYPFTPQVIDEGPPIGPGPSRDIDLLFINELVPFVDGTSRVEIEGPTGVLHSVSAGSNAPTVQVVAPNGGETLDQPTITVSWTSDDVDGDLLTFSLQYSKDGGATWEMVAQYITGSQIELDATNIGRSDQGKFRVLVSDGVHTASDDSDGVFTVPNRIPSVAITEPAEAVTVAVGQTLSLEGDAYDVDIGTLADEQLTWSSSLDGMLGNGPSLGVASLSVGEHTITFTADDGQGGMTTDTVAVTVVAELSELPPVPDNLVVGPSLLTVVGAASGALAIENENSANALNWNAVASEPWVELSSTNGSTPADVAVSVNPAGLTPGRYSATITVNSDAGSRTVGVDATVAPCVGDCDGSGSVGINELIVGVNISLGSAPVGDCPSFDADGDGAVEINELIQAVNSALNGCG